MFNPAPARGTGVLKSRSTVYSTPDRESGLKKSKSGVMRSKQPTPAAVSPSPRKSKQCLKLKHPEVWVFNVIPAMFFGFMFERTV